MAVTAFLISYLVVRGCMHAKWTEDLWRKNNGFKTQGVTVSSWLIISQIHLIK